MPNHMAGISWRAAAITLAVVMAGGFAACGGDDDEETRETEAATTAAAEITLEITAPEEGDTVTSPVTLEVASTGVEVAPARDAVEGAAHYHAFVDQEEIPADFPVPQETEGIFHFATDSQELELEPGEHTVWVALGDNSHVVLEDAEQATVTFTVE